MTQLQSYFERKCYPTEIRLVASLLVLHRPIIVLSVTSRGHSECMRAAAVLQSF